MTRRARIMILLLMAGASVAALLLACGDRNPEATFDPDTGQHISGWLSDHGREFLRDAEACASCHGDDLGGGISGVGCFAESFDGMTCHGAGAYHGAGFGSPESHGPVAKAAPGEDSGFGSCKECHGGDYAGGAIRVSCFTAECHDVPAPHPPEPWLFSPLTHITTDVRNAVVCGECHLGDSGVPVEPGTPVGCFNNTLCHGLEAHPAGWSDPAEHGAAAKAAPGPTTGFAYCQFCHGADFSGGIAGVDCESCHGVPAPHPSAPWRDTTPTHTDTHEDNAVVCGECHLGDSGVPVDPGTPVGCFNNTLCHGLEAHPASWSDPAEHGVAAKAAPGPTAGFAYCQSCHGADFSGGIAGVDCESCHGVPAPHPPMPWRDTAPTHTDTDEGNAIVCGECHLGDSGVPVEPGTPVGCFNNTLCHGLEAHPAGWSTDHAIGLDTAGDVVACGTAECHGTDGGGGAVGISCYECHLGGPLPVAGIMHPEHWADPEGAHPSYLEALNKDARSCSPTRSGVAVFCHGPGLPNNPATIFAPPNGSWQRDPDGDPTCYDCHGKEWTLP